MKLEAGDLPTKRIEALAKRRAARGKGTPMWDNFGKLRPGLWTYVSNWEFLNLSRDRKPDGAPLALKATEIQAHMDGLGMQDIATRSYFAKMVTLVDIVWFGLQRKS